MVLHMKKVLKNLIQISHNELQNEQVRLNQLYSEFDRIQKAIQTIDAQIIFEQKNYAQNVIDRNEYLQFVKIMAQKREQFLRDIQEIMLFIEDSQNIIQLHFTKSKQFEIVKENIIKAKKKSFTKNHQKVLDQYANLRYQPPSF